MMMMMMSIQWPEGPLAGMRLKIFDVCVYSSACRASSGTFSSLSVVQTAWAFAHAGRYSKPLFDALAAQARAKLSGFGPGYLGDLLWSLAVVGYSDPELMDAALDVVAAKWDALTTDDASLAKVAWAFKRLGYEQKLDAMASSQSGSAGSSTASSSQ